MVPWPFLPVWVAAGRRSSCWTGAGAAVSALRSGVHYFWKMFAAAVSACIPFLFIFGDIFIVLRIATERSSDMPFVFWHFTDMFLLDNCCLFPLMVAVKCLHWFYLCGCARIYLG